MLEKGRAVKGNPATDHQARRLSFCREPAQSALVGIPLHGTEKVEACFAKITAPCDEIAAGCNRTSKNLFTRLFRFSSRSTRLGLSRFFSVSGDMPTQNDGSMKAP